MNLLYPATITFDPSDKHYFVQFHDIQEGITEGATLEEALYNAAEVLTLSLEARIDEKLDIPTPSDCTGKNIHLIAPSARVQAAMLFRMSRDNKSIAEIARVLESSWPAIARLEDPHHWPTLRQLERAAFATGHRLILSLEPIMDR